MILIIPLKNKYTKFHIHSINKIELFKKRKSERKKKKKKVKKKKKKRKRLP